jgi:HPt (histidine-containing phosphotransfer) domain-containing protein
MDYLKTKLTSHALKGVAGYMGASHIYYICETIQNSSITENPDKVLAYYPTLLEACITYRTYSRALFAEIKGESPYITDSNHETIPMS